MERLARQEKRNGMTRTALRLWGMFFLIAGICGEGLIQNRLLGMGTVTNQQLLDAMTADTSVMVLATLALVLQAVQVCAIPVFCFLLVEGFQHTRDEIKFFLRVAGVALLSELPYNLAVSGSLWDLSSRNPAIGAALSLLMLIFFKRFEGKGFGKTLIKLLIGFCGILWCSMLKIRDGQICIVMVGMLWVCRNRQQFRILAGCIAAALCALFSPFYLAAPMGFLVVHGYRGEQGEENRLVNYLAYPVLLLFVGIAGNLMG